MYGDSKRREDCVTVNVLQTVRNGKLIETHKAPVPVSFSACADISFASLTDASALLTPIIYDMMSPMIAEQGNRHDRVC